MPNVPKLSWTQAAVILGSFACVIVLAVLKVELTAFLAFAVAVLIGIGVVQNRETKTEVSEVRAQTNGTNTKLVAAAMIALAHTPSSDADRILALLTDAGVLPTAPPPALPAGIPTQREPIDVDATPVP